MQLLMILAQLLGLVALGGYVWLVVRAFKTRIWWGFGVMLLSPVTAVIYSILHWQDAHKPFIVYAAPLSVSLALLLVVFTTWGGWDVVRSADAVRAGIHNEDMSEAEALQFMNDSLDFLAHSNTSDEDQRKIALMRGFVDKAGDGTLDAEAQQAFAEELLDIAADEDMSPARRRQLEQLRRDMEDRAPPSASRADEPAPSPVVTDEPAPPGNSTPRYRHSFVDIELADAGQYVGRAARVTHRDGRVLKGRLMGADGGLLSFEQRYNGGTLAFEYTAAELAGLEVLDRIAY
jgi:hypothetical protein